MAIDKILTWRMTVFLRPTLETFGRFFVSGRGEVLQLRSQIEKDYAEREVLTHGRAKRTPTYALLPEHHQQRVFDDVGGIQSLDRL